MWAGRSRLPQAAARRYVSGEDTVRTRTLGKTGLVVSELTLGTWGLAGDAYGPVEHSDAEITIARALDLGINVVETAGIYGAGRMEELVGRVIAGRPEVIVVTIE